jgi:hypothetical protein
MLAKASCITLHTLVTILSIRPPASSKTKEKADKVKDEGLFSLFMLKLLPQFGQFAAIIAAALHILLMSRGIISGDLRTWQVLTTLSGVMGYLLRTWSFRTLDRFFTVSVFCVSCMLSCFTKRAGKEDTLARLTTSTVYPPTDEQ